MVDSSPTDIAWLLKADDEELFERLGEELLGSGLGAFPVNPRVLIREARDWFEMARSDLQAKVCSSPVIRDAAQGGPSNLVALAIALDPAVGDYRVSLVVAAIVVRAGLVSFCSGWKPLK